MANYKTASISLLRKIGSIMVFILLYHLLTFYDMDYILQFSNLPTVKEIANQIPLTLSDVNFLYGIVSSLGRVFIGFMVAFIAAVFLGILLAISPLYNDIFLPIIEIFRPIPNVAWVPISILLFPNAEQSIYFITFIGAFFPILLNTIKGVKSVKSSYLKNALILKFNTMQILTHVIVPSSSSLVLTGAKIGMGVSWLGVIVAESTYGKDGIGYFTFKSLQLIDYPNIIIGMLTIGLLGTLSGFIIQSISKQVNKWESLEKEKKWNLS